VIRVLIVAAGARTRRALESWLPRQAFEAVGSFATLEAAADFAESEIGAVLVEVADGSTREVLESLEETGLTRETRVAVLLEEASPETVSEFLRVGVRAVLPADAQPEQVVGALEAVNRGLLVLNPGDVAAVRPAAIARAAVPEELSEPLTPRENEVLRLMAGGLGNKEIAARLSISEHTAKFHVASILGKLGAATRTEAVSIGMRRGLILL